MTPFLRDCYYSGVDPLFQMPQTADPLQAWLTQEVKEARKSGKLLKGLTVSQQAGKARVRYVATGADKPQTGTLPITWELANGAQILTSLESVSRLVANGQTVKESCSGFIKPTNKTGSQYDWREVYRDWLSRKRRSLESMRKFDSWFDRFIKLLSNPGAPCHNGSAIMTQYAKTYFVKLEPGSDGRARPLAFFESLITFAIEKKGLPKEWAVSKQFRLDLVGNGSKSKRQITPPVTTPDLKRLLDQLEDKYPDIYTMVSLMAFYGLMGSELAVIRWFDGGLETYRERRHHALPKHRDPRNLVSISFVDDPDLGDRICKEWIQGERQLPISVYNAIARIYDGVYSYDNPNYKAVGDAVRQVLDRNEYWKALVRVNPDITPYSLRHSFAWRCHTELNMDGAKVSPWMGHSNDVHNKHYAAWFSKESQRRYREEMIAFAQERARLISKNDSAKSHEHDD